MFKHFLTYIKIPPVKYISFQIATFNISYQLPPVKQGASASFKDVVLTFNGDWQNVKITGRLEDFYELFTSPVFTNKRPRVLLVRDEISYNPQKDKKPEKSKQVSERESFSNNNTDEPE